MPIVAQAIRVAVGETIQSSTMYAISSGDPSKKINDGRGAAIQRAMLDSGKSPIRRETKIQATGSVGGICLAGYQIRQCSCCAVLEC